MAKSDALRFLARCRDDADFRARLYGFDDQAELKRHLEAEGYAFSPSDIAEATAELRVRAADEGEAEVVAELARWYEWLAPADEMTNDSDADAHCRPSDCVTCHAACASAQAGTRSREAERRKNAGI